MSIAIATNHDLFLKIMSFVQISFMKKPFKYKYCSKPLTNLKSYSNLQKWCSSIDYFPSLTLKYNYKSYEKNTFYI